MAGETYILGEDFFRSKFRTGTGLCHHSRRSGLTGLEGHPSLGIAPLVETHQHDVEPILLESLEHERAAVRLYNELLECVAGASVYLEEYARKMIAQEELHTMELRKMLRDFN